jgi:twitching motility two-component system response regulator PilH
MGPDRKHADRRRRHPPVAPSPAASERTVVVVEDHRDLRAAIAETLERSRWSVGAFASVEEALPQIRRLLPSVVLTDINLGELSGRALAREMRHDPTTAPIPIVAMSGSVLPTDGVLRDFSLFLLKPVELSRLDATLRIAIAARRASG